MNCISRSLRRARIGTGFSTVQRRCYAVQAPGNPPPEVFNEKHKWLQRERAASKPEASRQVDALRDEIASRLCERLLDIKRDFSNVLDLGAGPCTIARTLTQPNPDPDSTQPITAPLSTRISNLTCVDTSPTLLHRDASLPFNHLLPSLTRTVVPTLEQPLPFAPNTFNAILSCLSLHWVNDLPGLLGHCNALLCPDSPFIGAMLGGDTLYELRTSLQLAEMSLLGGTAQHMSPLADVRDVGGVLQRAGFKLLTVDIDDLVIEFPSVFDLMVDLQAMGESNAAVMREPSGLRRDVMAAAEAIYRELHGEDGNEGVPATFRIIYMIGWKEGEGQQTPLERGSGMVSIKEVLEGKKEGSGDDK
ncbi:S-adenosyl-L-methionine-dependent methyltransferase [Viridothelium virens]|uniref:S-adenosyl-L-methionine-dependent methyltransferase n=1 Tax=Viridothelium virens TaxID=1048519 RepID=A0A6A6HGG6_VIRVR|nr:S-adenosyl-L-methionine-dependent methyltransferase [Viridothelium virens]